jgi:hypothetical protein
MKVFIGPFTGMPHSLAFEQCKQFEIVEESEQADIIIIVGNHPDLTALRSIVRPHHVLVLLEIFHMDHHMSYEYYSTCAKAFFTPLTKKVLVVHTNLSIRNNPMMVFYDHMIDRQKLYCTEYDENLRLNGRVWTYGCTKEMFELRPINKTRFKKFLGLMRVYHPGPADSEPSPRMGYRTIIKKLLSDSGDAFVSDSNASAAFLPHGATPGILDTICSKTRGSWFPVSYVYYDSSVVSVYTETLVHNMHGKASMVTEKSLDPLLRGNFILPFGYTGLIKDILAYGFRLPQWIDYSYDSIEDNEERFAAYLSSLNNLIGIPAETMYQYGLSDYDILKHNREVVYNTPFMYPLLAEKIQACIDVNEANDWQT